MWIIALGLLAAGLAFNVQAVRSGSLAASTKVRQRTRWIGPAILLYFTAAALMFALVL